MIDETTDCVKLPVTAVGSFRLALVLLLEAVTFVDLRLRDCWAAVVERSLSCRVNSVIIPRPLDELAAVSAFWR